MRSCPTCNKEALIGALFCNECGSKLINMDRYATQSNLSNDDVTRRSEAEIETGKVKIPVVEGIYLRLIDSGKIFTLNGKTEFTIGRSAEGQSILPDLDMEAYSAYEKGVSMLHAKIKIQDSKATIIDLGSVNGTKVNGVKITPSAACPLNNKDIVTLGKFQFQVLLH
jgi:pSer/pThr/pTyr-binding forkhead associated (FHA) protein